LWAEKVRQKGKRVKCPWLFHIIPQSWLAEKILPFRQGKHSVRRIAGRGSAKGAPTPSPLKGEFQKQKKKRSRAYLKSKKTAIITARMTPGIKDIIQHLAEKAGMTVTDYIITCALGKEIVRVDGLDEILAEPKSQGRNLNQLTTLANMGRLTVLSMDDLFDAYSNLYWQVEKLCERVK